MQTGERTWQASLASELDKPAFLSRIMVKFDVKQKAIRFPIPCRCNSHSEPGRRLRETRAPSDADCDIFVVVHADSHSHSIADPDSHTHIHADSAACNRLGRPAHSAPEHAFAQTRRALRRGGPARFSA